MITVLDINNILTKNCKIFDELFDFWLEILPACRTCKDIRCSQVHETILAEGVSTL